MLRRKEIFTVMAAALIFVGVVFLAFSIPEDGLNRLTFAFNFLGGLASLVTLAIAALLYNKFGVEGSVLEKNVAAMNDFLLELKKLNLVVASNTNSAMFTMRFFLNGNFDSGIERYKKDKIFFTADYLESMMNLQKHCDDFFLPPSIVKILKKLIPSILSYENNLPVEYFKAGQYKSVFSKEQISLTNMGDKEMTVGEFYAHWLELRKSILQWFAEHSSVKLDINF